VALTCDLADLDCGPDGDLQLARLALEHGRSGGESFDAVFDSVLAHFAERPVSTFAERRRLDQLLASLIGVRDA
jgi:hypothetical protein